MKNIPSLTTATGTIYRYIFELLEKNPEGLRWVELNTLVEKEFPHFHPKTINGCVWKLIELFPDKVHKPKKGVFQLIK
jgi:hypothetical protein